MHAETGDRDKPINYQADTGDVNYQTKVGTLLGNVVITQGTMTIHADKIIFKQNPDNSVSATAYGNPVTLSAEARRRRRILRRLRAARRVRRPEAVPRAVRPRAAEEGQRRDPQQLHFLQRGDRVLQGRRSRRLAPAAADGEPALGARVRGVFQPESKDGKGAKAAGSSATGTNTKEAPKSNPPLPLKPDAAIAPAPAK